MKNSADKVCRKNRNPRFVFKAVFFNLAVYGITWQNILEGGGAGNMTLWFTRIASWIPKATDTHSQYVILIVFLQ